MDMTSETRNLKFLLIGVVIFAVTGIFSANELRYALWGNTVDAQLVRVTEFTERGRRGSVSHRLKVDYRFPDADLPAEVPMTPGLPRGHRAEFDDVSTDWPIPGDSDTIPVQYIPGKPGSSRLAGHSHMLAVYVFLASLGVIAYFLFRFWKFYKS